MQIEDTEFLGQSPDGTKRVRINKAVPPGYDVRQVRTSVDRPLACMLLLRSCMLCGVAAGGVVLVVAAKSKQHHPFLCHFQVGSDMAAGEVVLQAGHHIDAAEVGILATVGATTVQ